MIGRAADTYLLANIQNEDDEDAPRLLRIRRVAPVPHHGRVLLVDAVLPDDDRPHFGKDLDIRIRNLFGGGKERTTTEYLALLTDAGLAGERVTELAIDLSLVEAVPR